MSSRADRDLLGDKLIHDYFGVKIDIVWQIVHDQLPALAEQIATLLREAPRENGTG